MAELLQNTYKLLASVAEICVAHGVKYAVLSPGSRSAPIALSFLRNADIRCFVIPDERSAAYTALGIARQSGSPVVLICTSGTATLNYGPAIAEAFFSQIPLLVLTADRPPEWIAQADNQSIFQENIYGAHAKWAAHFPVDYEHPDSYHYALRLTNEALNMCTTGPQGPVHINIPLREPLYLENTAVDETDPLPIIRTAKISGSQKFYLKEKKVLIVAGLYLPTWRDGAHLKAALSHLTKQGIVFIPDVTSNLHQVENAVLLADLMLNLEENLKEFQPDCLITIGGAVVSKKLKDFLRAAPLKEHWHIGEGIIQPDTYYHLTQTFPLLPEDFFSQLQVSDVDKSYSSLWQQKQKAITASMQKTLKALDYCEQSVVNQVLQHMPPDTVLHLGNSLPVRHVSAFPLLINAASVFSNRGASGIDGSLSSAAGHSMIDDRLHLLICGDLSFMYDSNGLWNNHLRGNLKIIILNNHGGGIFRELPGSSAQPELEEYFVVPQPMHFEAIAKQFNAAYLYADSYETLNHTLADFFLPQQHVAILEINFTSHVKFATIRQKIEDAQP